MPNQFPEIEFPRKRSTIWCMLILGELEQAFLLAEGGMHLVTPAQRIIFRAMRDDAVAAAHDLLLAEGNHEEISRWWPDMETGKDSPLDRQNAKEVRRANEDDSVNKSTRVSVDEFIRQIKATKQTVTPNNPLYKHLEAIRAFVDAECSWLDISRYLRLHEIDMHPSAIANYYNRMRRQSS